MKCLSAFAYAYLIGICLFVRGDDQAVTPNGGIVDSELLMVKDDGTGQAARLLR
jgi:hypothetical protein